MSATSRKVDAELHIELHEGLDRLDHRKDVMTDRYQDFVSSSLGQLLVKNLGLPNPVALDRYVAGSPLVDGTVVVGGAGRLVEHLPGILDTLDIATVDGHRGGHALPGRWSSTRPG